MQKIFLKFILIFSFFILIFFNIKAQSDKKMFYADEIFKSSIHSVLMYNKQWELSRPIMILGNNDTLKLSFDDISSDAKSYYYKIIHCNSDWQPSDIYFSDYIDGFEENTISDYDFSINTLVSYVHYNLTIPNEQIKIKISGNYILKVYEDANEENMVLSRRFYCVENKVNIIANCHKPTDIEHRNTGQEVDFYVEHNGLKIDNPYNDVKVIIAQNGRSDNSISNLKPLFIGASKLDYSYDVGNVFDGNNEFRNVDLKSIRYYSENIQSIEYIAPMYYVNLKDNLSKYRDLYFFENDINGRYLVKIAEGQNSELEADYVNVKFRLFYDIPLANQKVYVFGALTNWQLKTENEMKYNFDSHFYELNLLLKQGYYNYCFATLDNEKTQADVRFFEGSYYETENEYIIYVYHKTFTDKYEHLVGYQIVNSQKK